MSIFNNMFGSASSGQQQDNVNWIQLSTPDQLDEIITSSQTQPVVIFKHSTRCSISRMALKQFESAFDLQDKVTPYFVDLIANREVSNAIATRFGVQHQSPQLLLIKNGVSVYDASHNEIDAQTLSTKM